MAKPVLDPFNGFANPLRLAAYSAAIHLPRPTRPVEDVGGGWQNPVRDSRQPMGRGVLAYGHMATEYAPSVQAFWDAFADATGTDAAYEAWAFGGDDMPELATELGLLVRDGPKRATTSKLSSFEEEGEPMPEVGGYSVILDGTGEPICIIRTTRIDIVPFGEADEEFAWVEGEGDRSLKYWREAHTWFFEAEGSPITDDELVVLERFDKVWPP